jgi:dTDP-4-dehydrorhamnose reductase
MKVLVLGASGMLGSAMVRVLSESDELEVFGSIRSKKVKMLFSPNISDHIVQCNDVTNYNDLVGVFDEVQPDVVINCISLSKALLSKSDPLLMISIYALLPHQLAKICSTNDSRLIHMSTDGVFSGSKGGYVESDPFDAQDFYGITKFIGEVQYPHSISIRTSIIGHELQGRDSLLSWFLSRQESCKCFSNVIFSGFPSVALAQIVRDIVIPQPDLFGVYHIASNPISKCDLLRLIADVYGKEIEILPDKEISIDRSLNAERFRIATGYTPPDWQSLVKLMHSYQ